MKHKISITLILLGMFIVAQLIGVFVINAYAPTSQTVINPETGESEIVLTEGSLPFGLQVPEDEPTPSFLSIVFAFALAFALIFILMKYKWKMVIRLWFFFVITLSLGIAINAFLKYTTLTNISIIALIIAVPLSFFKIFKPNPYIHNLTELFIYPGIAAVFVPILTPISIIGLLILISIYDMWAVWQSGIMQKMAKFQMSELKIFGGFLVPSISKKVKGQIARIKQKYKNKKMPMKIKNKKFKVNLAILGGGDVIFPIITAGVFMWAYPNQILFGINGLIPALFIIGGALIGLTSIFLFSEKGKAYPAMPYITTGIFLGMLIWRIVMF
ncbi:MAG: presenilin family intramembrane aspartyl protease [archaeon]